MRLRYADAFGDAFITEKMCLVDRRMYLLYGATRIENDPDAVKALDSFRLLSGPQ